MTNDHYILQDGEPVAVDIAAYIAWRTAHDRIVAKDTIGRKEVSTVFLGYDCNFRDDGPPLFFETLIFPDCDYIERYVTLAAAKAGHARAVQLVRAGKELDA